MPRPCKKRKVCFKPTYSSFIPLNHNKSITIDLSLDEYETIRLIDLENYSQEQCAKAMDIARTTVTAIYHNARQKIANAIVNGYQLNITGGNIILCHNRHCCPKKKEKNKMKVAITYQDNQVFQHFGHCKNFMVYEIEDKKIINNHLIDTSDSGHGALATLLSEQGIEILICGGIGGGARSALANNNITLYPGVTGNIDEVINDFINDKLNYNPDTTCNHHGDDHNCNNEHHCNEKTR